MCSVLRVNVFLITFAVLLNIYIIIFQIPAAAVRSACMQRPGTVCVM